MFLTVLQRRNSAFLDAAASLHRAGQLPPNTTVLDIDTIAANAREIAAEADRLGVRVFAMTKQIGRNPDAIAAIRAAGITESVGVDLECATAAHAHGLACGHLGHLVQVPRSLADVGAQLAPRFWTVFSLDKAREVAEASSRAGRVQDVLLRIQAPGDTFYRGHEGGFPAADVVEVARQVDALPGVRVAGVATFPAMLFDAEAGEVRPTPNLRTVQEAKERLEAAGFTNVELNAPGTTSAATLRVVAEHGATQVEPGHGFTGTTPWHAVEDLVERPAIAYVTEVSHVVGDDAYVFGGGLYADPVLGRATADALVYSGHSDTARAERVEVEMPAPEAIDYCAVVPGIGSKVATGDTVILGFRTQVFVTRSLTAGIHGVASGEVRLGQLWSANGSAPLEVRETGGGA